MPGLTAFVPYGVSRAGMQRPSDLNIVHRSSNSLLSIHNTRAFTRLQMGFLDNLLGKSKGQKQEKIGPVSLPPGWTQLTDPSSGDIYYFNEASGESTWDRPAAPSRLTRPSTGTALPSTQQAPAVPRSYEEIHAQAIAGIAAALKRGLRALEVEFPAIAQVEFSCCVLSCTDKQAL